MQVGGSSIFTPNFGAAGASPLGAGAADSAAEQFRAAAKKTPIERMREQILKSMGLSEDKLKTMPGDQRAAIEKKIADTIANRMKEAAAKKGQLVDISA